MKSRSAIAFCLIGLALGCGHRKQPKPPAKTTAEQSAAVSQPPAQAPSAAPAAQASGPMLFEFNVADPAYKDHLLRGFYEGSEAWKWTGRAFAVVLDVPPPLDAPTFLDVDINAPNELMKVVHQVTLTARVNGQIVGRETYTKAGRYFPEFPVPLPLLKKSPAELDFEVDHTFKDLGTNRDLGLIVVGVSLVHREGTVLSRKAATELAHAGYLQMLRERQVKLPIQKQTELMKLFHDIPIWSQMWFENVPIEKNPLDLWMMQQIIYETRPEFVIETGTYKGGSALYWAYTLNGMGLENSRVITIDIADFTANAATNPLWSKYVTFFHGSSTAPEIVAEIAKRVKGHTVLVTLDSDHSEKHVLDELHAYAPMVTSGSYLVVEDTHMDGVPTAPGFGPGPMSATLKFLKEGGKKHFEQDLSREAFIMTFNPGGWLKRK